VKGPVPLSVSTRPAADTAATKVEKVASALATSTIVPTDVSSVIVSLAVSESLEHADNVNNAASAAATSALLRKTFITLSLVWVYLSGKT
jgi:hypothetical protein